MDCKVTNTVKKKSFYRKRKPVTTLTVYKGTISYRNIQESCQEVTVRVDEVS